MGTKRSLISSIALVALGMVIGAAGVIAFNFITKKDSITGDAPDHYVIEQTLAEDTCINENLIDLEKYSFSPRHTDDHGVKYQQLQDFDKNGNYLVSLVWGGYNKAMNIDVSFQCIVSSDKNKNTTIHYLSVSDGMAIRNGKPYVMPTITIAGDKNYKRYREDGKETFSSKYSD